MTRRPSYRTALATIAAAAFLVAATHAAAHAHLVSATPAADTTVSILKGLTLKFSETLEPRFSGVDVVSPGGAKVTVQSIVPAHDPATIRVTMAGRLAPGSYRVLWHAVSADGHRTSGRYIITLK